MRVLATKSSYYRLFWGAALSVLLLSGCASSPSAAFTATPTSGDAPLSVRFDASGSSGSIDRYRWDFGDGSDPRVTTTPTTEYEYTLPQRYDVTLVIEGSSGAGRTTRSVVVRNPPQPSSPLGFYAVEFSNIGLPIFLRLGQSAATSPDVALQQNDLQDTTPQDTTPQNSVSAQVFTGPVVDSGIVLESGSFAQAFSTEDGIYLSADFVLTNNTDRALTNLTLLGYSRAEFREGSAISNPLTFDGTPTPSEVLATLRPTHLLEEEDGRLVGVFGSADFVAIAEDAVPDLAATYPFVTTVFPYGYTISDEANDRSRSIAPGARGRFVLSFAIPRTPATDQQLASFTWNAVLVSDSDVRVTQAAQENSAVGWNSVLTRARLTNADTITAIGRGTRTTPPASCSILENLDLVGLDNVRLAGTGPSDPNYLALLDPAEAGSPTFSGCVTP